MSQASKVIDNITAFMDYAELIFIRHNFKIGYSTEYKLWVLFEINDFGQVAVWIGKSSPVDVSLVDNSFFISRAETQKSLKWLSGLFCEADMLLSAALEKCEGLRLDIYCNHDLLECCSVIDSGESNA